MADKNLPVPAYLDIDADTTAAAAAAMNRGAVLVPPDDAVVTTGKKGEVYERWTEAGVIEATWREATDTGLIQSVVQVKFRAGGKNAHSKAWFRHMLNYRLIAGTASEEEKKKHVFMNDKSMFALTTLLAATGFAPAGGGLKGSLLMHMFPPKGEPGAKAPIIGKEVFVNICNQPNTGKGAKTDRQSQAESYLSVTPPVVAPKV
jgi:hypothetical protein